MPDTEDYINTAEAAALLGIPATTLRAHRCNRRELVRSVKIGSAVLYARSEVERYVSARADRLSITEDRR